MTDDLAPAAWREAAQSSEIKRYALIEMATLPAAARTRLIEMFGADSRYWPLIDDNTQLHLQREGPWLLEFDDARFDVWQDIEPVSCALHAWIESELAGDQLATQLAPAMVVENPSGKRSLLRFYVAEVIERLYNEAPAAFHPALFGHVQRWWYRNDHREWAALAGVKSHAGAGTWQLKVSDDLWSALHGDPEVMGLTAELVENAPELLCCVCSCERPRLVAKALKKTDRHGLTRASDRRIYTYLQLSQGENAWQSRELQALLQQASSGETPLLELLANTFGESNR